MTTHSQWYQTLDAETKAAIGRLRRRQPLWNLVLPLFVLLWIGLGYLLMQAPHWSLKVVISILIGMVINGIGNFMHEGIHGNLFRSKRWNRWVGFLAGAPVLLAVSAFGANHLLHHRHTRTSQDPDELTNISQHAAVRMLYFYAWLFFGTLIFGARLPMVLVTRCTRQERIAVVQERALMLAIIGSLLAAAYVYGFLDVMLYCWFIPLLIASLMVNLRGWAEHQLTAADHPLRQTRTVTSSRIYSFLNINLNYHLEHHLFPGVPWYNLPALHHLLQPEYKKAGASVYRSYFWFFWDALRIGVHGQTPNFQR